MLKNQLEKWTQISGGNNALKTILKLFADFQKGWMFLIINSPDLLKEGIIQRFEFTHELAWKLMKDYLVYEGIQNITGSRSATREAFNKGLIDNGQVWMDMIESRNITVNTYREDILEKEFLKIKTHYAPLLYRFYEKMNALI